MNNKEWINVSYSNRHQISSYGRVRSIDFIENINDRWGKPTKRKVKGKILKIFGCGKYLGIRLSFKGQNYYIHRLVAEHFIDGDKSLDVNHIDGVKTNNTVENLEFVTPAQNMLHSTHVLGNRKGQFGVGGVRIDY
jgi:hypothetical protein